jgi:hypothetical protein
MAYGRAPLRRAVVTGIKIPPLDNWPAAGFMQRGVPRGIF